MTTQDPARREDRTSRAITRLRAAIALTPDPEKPGQGISTRMFARRYLLRDERTLRRWLGTTPTAAEWRGVPDVVMDKVDAILAKRRPKRGQRFIMSAHAGQDHVGVHTETIRGVRWGPDDRGRFGVEWRDYLEEDRVTEVEWDHGARSWRAVGVAVPQEQGAA